jgi:hypothetical protein
MGLFTGSTRGVRHFKDRSRLTSKGEAQEPDNTRPWTRVYESPRKTMRRKHREDDNRRKRPHKQRSVWRKHHVGSRGAKKLISRGKINA